MYLRKTLIVITLLTSTPAWADCWVGQNTPCQDQYAVQEQIAQDQARYEAEQRHQETLNAINRQTRAIQQLQQPEPTQPAYFGQVQGETWQQYQTRQQQQTNDIINGSNQ